MRKTIWQIRLPTLLAILLIAFGTGLTSFFVKNGVTFIGKASPSDTPTGVRVTNVSDTAFTVTYTTSEAVTGAVSYGKDKTLGGTALDDRDQLSGKVQSYKVHHITIRNVDPNATYFFSITSGGTTYVDAANVPFEVTTSPHINDTPTQQQPLSGTILTPDGNNAPEAIVYVVGEKTQTLSALTKSDGTYLIPLNALRSITGQEYALLSKNTSFKLLIVGGGLQATASLLPTQIQPVPPMTLSQSYDFTLSQTPIASVSGNFGFPTFTATPSANKDPKLVTPKKGESFTDNKPLFKGTTVPNATVSIEIHSPTTVEAKTQADTKGVWTYRPKEALAPGDHTITITAPDQFGILKTIKQSFTVYASGTQVNQTATPSATPIITLTPTPTRAPTAVPSVTLIPTPTTVVVPLATVVPTTAIGGPIVPVASVTPTVVISKAPVAPIPSVGSSSTIVAAIAGTFTLTTGVLLFLFSRGTLL